MTGDLNRIRALFGRLRWEDLDPLYLRGLVELARREDLEGAGLKTSPTRQEDLTTLATVDPSLRGRACLCARREIVVCGSALIPLILEAYGGGCTFEPACTDGDSLKAGGSLGILKGSVVPMLQAERVILNFLQHLSGISTHTARHVQALEGSTTRLLDTRKTTPGYRMLEKYAVACGGGWNHRLGLFGWILVKDNHLASGSACSGLSLESKVLRVVEENPGVAVEVEVDRLDQIEAVLSGGAHIVMLDNFTNGDLVRAKAMIGERAVTEVSGGITEERLREIGPIGLDFVSCGGLIHQSRWVDIGLDWDASGS